MKHRPVADQILTPREWEVLELIAEGLTNEAIAANLGISFGTAKYHVSEIMGKLGVGSRKEAIRYLKLRQRARADTHGLFVLPAWTWLAVRSLPRAALVLPALAALLAVASSLYLLKSTSEESAQEAVYAAGVGLDLALNDEDQPRRISGFVAYPHTILIAKDEPRNTGAAGSVIDGLRRVDSLAELEAVLTPTVRLIIIDSSAAKEFTDPEFLKVQRQQGRAIMGLNMTPAELFQLSSDLPSSDSRLQWETLPGGAIKTRDATAAPPPEVLYPPAPQGTPVYSLLFPESYGSQAVSLSFGLADVIFGDILSSLDSADYGSILPRASRCERQINGGEWVPTDCT